MHKVLVLGDICLDVNNFGKVERLSPEAPVPVFNYDHSEYKLGMAGNVAVAIKKLNNDVTVFLKIGNDKVGWEIGEALYKNDIKSITIDVQPNHSTTKERYFVGKHYLFRVDHDNNEPLIESQRNKVLKEVAKQYRIIILQDYAKGFFDKELLQEIVNRKPSGTLLIADGHSSRDSEFYYGIDYLKLNEKEFNTVFKQEFSLQAAQKYINNIIVTKGDQPTKLYTYRGGNNITLDIEVPKIDNVVDVTGAGDVFTAHLAHHLAGRVLVEKAIAKANEAASISVQHLGCYCPSLEDLK